MNSDPRSVGSEDLVDQLIADSDGAVPAREELDRVLALPRRPQPIGTSEWLIDHVTRYFSRGNVVCRCREIYPGPCITRLNEVQAATLFEAPQTGGTLGLLGVGAGKSLLNILLPLAIPGVRRALLLIPPDLRAQFFEVDFPLYSQHFRVPLLAGTPPPWDPMLPVLHVMAYSELSQAKSTAAVEALAPDLIIADEAHKLANQNAAGAGRVLRYLRAHPEVRLCVHSGTLSKKSILDYAHLAGHALKAGSPLPLDRATQEEWAGAIDISPDPDPMGALGQLCRPGEHIRQGFRRRLVETRGVLATSESAIGTALVFALRRPPPMPLEVKEAITGARTRDERPDGDILTDDLARSKCMRELACGFYYRWTFPRGEKRELIEEWLAARKLYMKEVRDFLKGGARAHMDSPLLLWLAAQRWHEGYRAPSAEAQARIHALEAEALEHEELAEATDSLSEGADRLQAAAHCREEAKALRASGIAIPPRTSDGPLVVWPSVGWPDWARVRKLVQPVTEPVWLSDWLVQDAAEWAREKPGIVWYEHTTFGEAVAKAANVPLYGGGAEASAEIIREKGKRSIVASIDAHHKGKNLQHAFWRNLVANPPSSDDVFEQLVGRSHRPGQPADEVRVDYYAHTREFAGAVEKARELALFNQDTTGAKRKLRIGTWIR